MEKEKRVEINDFTLLKLQEALDYFIEHKYPDTFILNFESTFFKIAFSLSQKYLQNEECSYLRTPKRIFRSCKWNNYWIVYKIELERILIIHLFHTIQNPKKIRKIKKD